MRKTRSLSIEQQIKEMNNYLTQELSKLVLRVKQNAEEFSKYKEQKSGVIAKAGGILQYKFQEFAQCSITAQDDLSLLLDENFDVSSSQKSLRLELLTIHRKAAGLVLFLREETPVKIVDHINNAKLTELQIQLLLKEEFWIKREYRIKREGVISIMFPKEQNELKLEDKKKVNNEPSFWSKATSVVKSMTESDSQRLLDFIIKISITDPKFQNLVDNFLLTNSSFDKIEDALKKPILNKNLSKDKVKIILNRFYEFYSQQWLCEDNSYAAMKASIDVCFLLLEKNWDELLEYIEKNEIVSEVVYLLRDAYKENCITAQEVEEICNKIWYKEESSPMISRVTGWTGILSW